MDVVGSQPESVDAVDQPFRVPDPREEEPWFHALPAHRQKELRAYWDERRGDPVRWHRKSVRRGRHLAAEGAALMCIPLLLANGLLLSFPMLMVALGFGGLCGAGVGVLLHLHGGGRFQAAMLGALTWLGAQLVIGMPPFLFLFLGVWLTSTLFAAWGMRVEFRQLEGLD